ncbi:hypothetical protein IP360_06285 [Helicobacter winghamensis]|uniref:hypothetical protein n=1 Tax=Helicobacter winghamensis TaxID=157268 RepID=UPI0027A3CD7D
MRLLIVCFGILFGACSAELDKESKDEKMDSNKTFETKKVKEAEEVEALETPLQKELKKNLKSHLDSLSKELHSKNLGDLRFENTGAKEHFEQFESLSKDNLKGDLQKDSNKDSPSLHLQKAYILQETQIQKLRHKNDEIGK